MIYDTHYFKMNFGCKDHEHFSFAKFWQLIIYFLMPNINYSKYIYIYIYNKSNDWLGLHVTF